MKHDFDSLYKEQIDKLCENMDMPDADEMLRLAKARDLERTEIIMTKKNRKNINRFTVIAAVSAACLTATAATAYAYSNGSLGSLFSNIFHDDIGSRLVEEGYVKEHDVTLTDELFTATLAAVAGDQYNPTLIVDIRINDEELAARCDRLEIDAYVLDEYDFDNSFEKFGTFDAVGYRDEEDHSLYHVNLPAGWTLVNSERGVAYITHIRVGNAEGMTEYDTDFEYRFDIPENSLKRDHSVFLDGTFLEYNGVTFQMGTTLFNAYETSLDFYFDLPASFYDGVEKDTMESYEKLREFWADFTKNVIVTADGVDYAPILDEDHCWAYFNGEFDANGYEATGCQLYDPCDFDNAQNISVSLGDQVIVLKKDGLYADNDYEEGRVYTFYEYTDVVANYKGVDFALDHVCYAPEKTDLSFKFYAPEMYYDMDEYDAERDLSAKWLELLSDMVITVDGEEYRTTSGKLGGVAYDGRGAYGPQYECWTNCRFPGIDFESAETVTITMGGVTMPLKFEGISSYTATFDYSGTYDFDEEYADEEEEITDEMQGDNDASADEE